MNLFYDSDADLEILRAKKIAIIGYGNQGKPQAECFRDNGINVVVGARPDGKSWQKAKADGFEVVTIDEAVKKAGIVNVLLPDECQAECYAKQIAPHLSAEKTLCFAHGFNVTFGLIKPPKNVDVIMVAPNAPGREMRKRFLEGFGVPGTMAVWQDKSGKAKEIALAMAKALQLTKCGVAETTFKHETHSDLFAEETVIVGGLVELVKAAYETLRKKGFPAEIAYFCCLHELKFIADLIHERGIEGMYKAVSNTAEYGARTIGKKVIGREAKKAMENALKNASSGKFAKEWMNEVAKGLPTLKKLREKEAKHEIEKVGKKLRQKFVRSTLP